VNNDSFSTGWINSDDGHSGGTASDGSDLSLELQQQLQDMQHILYQKDQELSEERKRFAQRETTLLACLEEGSPEGNRDTGQPHYFL
jgi:hypothetical protein